ncbi:vacuolar-sorting protein SNF8 [Glomus cerebriforme]|uniref:Vacuolar-sorting protein SNF8 n=1 Tax=Glomus cerebriforme TaxID=658196 RepID=A0A397TKP4_9GLOM|nr:vacuolar-sorting protein SNF8 [Glomus cerebriforme]
MRKFGAGVSQIKRQQQANNQYREIGNTFADQQMEQMKAQLQIFKSNLVEFSRKYRKNIRKDPVLRQHFQTMCSTTGVDPLASNKGFWAELLGVGDFYYELGIQIIDVCLSTRGRNGGLVELGELKRQLIKMRSGGSSVQEISDDDIIRSIKTLKPLGNGFEILQIGDRKMVRSVPRELNKDQTDILVLAQERGYVTKELLSAEFGWGNERINDAIDSLLIDGLCWIDKQVHPPEYWVPSFFKGVDD